MKECKNTFIYFFFLTKWVFKIPWTSLHCPQTIPNGPFVLTWLIMLSHQLEYCTVKTIPALPADQKRTRLLIRESIGQWHQWAPNSLVPLSENRRGKHLIWLCVLLSSGASHISKRGNLDPSLRVSCKTFHRCPYAQSLVYPKFTLLYLIHSLYNVTVGLSLQRNWTLGIGFLCISEFFWDKLLSKAAIFIWWGMHFF